MRPPLLFLSVLAMIGAPALLAQSTSGAGTAGRLPAPQGTRGGTQTAPSSGRPSPAPGTQVPSTSTTPGGTETGAGVQPGGGVQPQAGAGTTSSGGIPAGTQIQNVPNQSPGAISSAPNQTGSPGATGASAVGTGNPLTGPGVGFADGGVAGPGLTDGGSPGIAGPTGPAPGIGLSDGGTGVGFGGADGGTGTMGAAGPQ
jgi:hypothetical protein